MNTDGQDNATHKKRREVLTEPMSMALLKANMTKKQQTSYDEKDVYGIQAKHGGNSSFNNT